MALLFPVLVAAQDHVVKPLYLSAPDQWLDRIDPVAMGSTNTLQTAPLAGSGFQSIVVVGAAVSSNAADSASSHSFVYDSGSQGNNRILMVGIGYRNESNQTVNTVSYGGQAMELVGTRARSSAFGSSTYHHTRVYIYRLIDPPVGSHTLQVNWSAQLTHGAVVGAVTYEGVDAETPTGVFAGNDGFSSTSLVTVAGTTERVMFGVVAGRTTHDYAVSGGGALLWSDRINPYVSSGLPTVGPGTGGTILQMDENGTNYYVHVFTNSGSTTFSPPAGVTNVEVLVVGGGGGGAGSSGNAGRGGGGAGGIVYRNALSVTNGNYTVTIGSGGNGGAASGQSGFTGINSVFGSLTALGGGGGGNLNANGGAGGSGGGVGVNNSGFAGGTGLQPGSASGGFGNGGGTSGPYQVGAGGGGGGGAGGVGGSGAAGTGGAGGTGLQFSQFAALGGSPGGWFAGGGGSSAGTTPGAGGSGGGGSGGTGSFGPISGLANTGGGGGGSQSGTAGGSGGSGIVIVRYASGTIGETASAAQSKPGGNSVDLSWSGSVASWAAGGVSLIPVALTNQTSFLQTPALCGDLIIKAGETISVHTYVSIVSGTMPVNPSITAALTYDGTNVVSLTNPAYDSGNGVLTWTGTLASDVTVPGGAALSLHIVSDEPGAVFRIEYDHADKPSRVILPTTTYIQIDSWEAYNAPYPDGIVISETAPGETVYLRAVVSDPFGYDDITGLDITISPTGSTVSATSVATSGCTRTYEWAWDTAGLAGQYEVRATAREGLENTVTDVADILFDFCFPLVGDPVFALGATSDRCQGTGTVTYAATSSNAVSTTYHLDVSSLAAGNTIDPDTGDVTYVAEWSGTSIITATAAGCGGPVFATHEVSVLPEVEAPVFEAGSESRRCRGAESIIYSATAAHSTGITYTLDAVSLAAGNTMDPATGEVTFAAPWNGTSIITATAAGCGGPVATAHTVLSSELVAVDDAVTGSMGKLLSFNVLTNDLCDVDPESLVVLFPPAYGTLQIGADGNMLYLPAGQFHGADVFSYQVCSVSDPSDCDVADVYITILDTGDDPCFEATRAKTYYLPFPENEDQVRQALLSAASANNLSSEVRTVISIAVPYPGTIITWDHWEDGYEDDISVPGQSTTLVWGDGDPSNGTAPGFPDDVIPPGAIIVLDNTFTYNPRNQAQVVYDGRDKIFSTADITISKVTGDAGSVGSTLLFDVQNIKGAIYDTTRFGEIFVLPFGEDITLGGTAAFKYTALFVRAIEDDTVVTLDLDGDGVPDATSPTLNEGDVWFYDGTASTPGQDPADVNQANDLKAGAVVAANRPVGADLLFGGIDTYGTRNVALLPSSYYGNTYYSPVYSTNVDAPVYAFFVNPLDTLIQIDWSAGTGATGTLQVAANGTGYLNLNQAAGYRFASRDGEIFTAMAVVDADGAGSAYDWAFTMIPENRLTPFAHVSWAPGSSDFSGNYNPVWVTAPEDTTIYIKFDGDLGSGTNVSPCYTSYDVAIPVQALESYLIYDGSDNDQSGLAVYSCDEIPIFAVWGQRPFGGTPSATPAIDVGYEVQPKCFDRYVFANDDREATEEDTPVVIDVLRNDASFLTSIDTTSVAAGLLQPANGSITIHTNGTITYTPDPGFLGIDVFEYWVCALEFPEICDVARVTITVSDCLAAVDENVLLGRVYLEQLPDNAQYDGETLMPGIRVNLYVDGDCNGVVDGADYLADSVLSDLSGRFSFRRGGTSFARDDLGTAPGLYNVNTGVLNWDGPWGRSSSTDIVSLVDPVPGNATNVALRLSGPSRTATRSLTFSQATGATLQFDVRRQDLNNQSETLLVRINGHVIMVIDDGGLSGTDLFYRTETLPISESLINADGVNTLSFETSGTTASDDSFWIDNVTLTYFPACYIVQVDTTDVSDFYEPAALSTYAIGFDSFGNCSPVLYLGIRAVITAVDDYETTLINTPLSLDVLANDIGALDVSTVSHDGLLAPSNGWIQIEVDGTITYTPNPGYEGTDQFEYRVCSLDDPNVCDVATVYLNIVCANVPGSNVIRGMVYDDVNLDGNLDIGEPGVQGFEVELYEDVDASGTLSPGDVLLDTRTTAANGTYQFVMPGVPATTYYLVRLVDPLPSGYEQLSSPVEYDMAFDGADEGICAIDFGLHVFRPGMEVTKAVTPAFYIGEGETMTYTFTVENTGNVVLTNLVVNDPRLGATFGPVTLPMGGTVVFTSLYEITTADINALSISNRVTAVTEDPHGRPLDDSDYIITLYDPATIGGLVWHDVDVNGFFSPGETGFPGVVVTLTGADILANPVHRVLSTAADGSYTFTDIRAGTYALTVTYPPLHASSADVVGTVYHEWSEPPPGAPRGSNADPQDGTVTDITLTGGERGINYNFGIHVPPTDVGVAKTVDVANPTVGDLVTFTVVVTNAGPNQTAEVEVTDLLPAGLTYFSSSADQGHYAPDTGLWVIGALEQGEAATLIVSALVAPGTGGQVLTNTAQVTRFLRPDPNEVNDEASAIVTVQAADIGLTKTVDEPQPSENDTVIFTIAVTNSGPDVATALEVIDLLPAGLTYVESSPSQGLYDEITGIWTIGALAADAAVTLTITVTVNPGTGGTLIENTAARYAADQEDPFPDNDSATAIITVTGADLSLQKSVNRRTPNENDLITYTLILRNLGPVSADSIMIQDELPSGVTFSTYDSNQGTYNPLTGEWDVGTLDVGENAFLLLLATVDTDTVFSLITNVAAITNSSIPDPNTDNNADEAVIEVSGLRLTKTSSPSEPVLPGDTIRYAIVLTNLTAATHEDVNILDAIPEGTTYVPDSLSVALFPPPGSLTAVEPGVGGTLLEMEENGTNYYVHVFTNAGATVFYPPSQVPHVEVLVVGGGGGGAGATATAGRGGGGAGGVVYEAAFPVSASSFLVSVGSGGAGGASTGQSGFSGGDSFINSLIALGGGGGGNFGLDGESGGSGGGAGVNNSGYTGGTGLQPSSASGGYGQDGGAPGPYAAGAGGGGGGGANATGGTGNASTGGAGGGGRSYAQFSAFAGSPGGWFGGGGGGSAGTTPGPGGQGGGGAGSTGSLASESGTANSGGGGGGAQNGGGGSGGSGMVIVRYPAEVVPVVAESFDTTTTFTAPPGVTSIVVEAWGGGGGPRNDSTTRRGGGGGGAYARSTIAVTPGQTYNVIVGLGGAVAHPGTVGNTGGNSHFDDGSQVTAQGGAGGTNEGGAGGSAAASVGGIRFSGGAGGNRSGSISGGGGGGGGSAFAHAAGAPGAAGSGATGGAGGDGQGRGGNGGNNGQPGQPGIVPGGGGGARGSNGGNGGAGADGRVVIRYQLPAGNPGVNGEHPNLATGYTLYGGQSIVATFDVVVNSPVYLSEIVNVVTADSHLQQFPMTEGVTNVLRNADLSVLKEVDNPTPEGGTEISYRVSLSNAGPFAATGVLVSEPLADGLDYVSHSASQGAYDPVTGMWNVGDLAIGGSAELDITVLVEMDRVGEEITNTAGITALDQADPNPDNNDDTVVIVVQGADIAISKAVDEPNPFAGVPVVFTIDAFNAGPNDATTVQVLDVLPDGLSFIGSTVTFGSYDHETGLWDIGDLPAGSNATLTVTALVLAETIDTVMTNTAALQTSAPVDPDTSNNVDQVTVAPLEGSELAITKQSDATENNIDVLPGSIIAYTVVVTNRSDTTHENVLITDPTPTGTTYVALSGELTYPGMVEYTVRDGFNNQTYTGSDGNAAWSGPWIETGETNGPLGGRLQVDLDVVRGEAYSLRMQGGSGARYLHRIADMTDAQQAILRFVYRRVGMQAGEVVAVEVSANGALGPWTAVGLLSGPGTDLDYVSAEYDITDWIASNTAVRFTMNGPVADTSYLWLDDIEIVYEEWGMVVEPSSNPPQMASGITLLPGAALTLRFDALVDDVPTGTNIVNTAWVTSARQLVQLAASVSDSIEFADLGLTKVALDPLPMVGEVVSYLITLRNAGPFPGTSVEIQEILPEELSFVSAVASTGTYDPQAGLWRVPMITVDGLATLTLTAYVDAQAAGLRLTNRVAVLALDQADLNLADNEDETVIHVAPEMRLIHVHYNTDAQQAEIHHVYQPGNQYDLLYVDSDEFSDALSNKWALAVRGDGPVLVDAGGQDRLPPYALSNGLMRFYRISAPGFWEENPRRASAEVAMLNHIPLYKGQNWVAFPGSHPTCTVQNVLSTDLPAAPYVFKDGAMVTWFQRGSVSLATQQIYLAKGGHNVWVCRLPEAKDGTLAHDMVMPMDEAVLLSIPHSAAHTNYTYVYMGFVPTNKMVQMVMAPSGTNRHANNLTSVRLPVKLHPADMNLLESGFTGSINPMNSDWIVKYDRISQKPGTTIYYNTSTVPGYGGWRYFSSTYPGSAVTGTPFGPDDGFLVVTRGSSTNWAWTNAIPYRIPNRHFDP